MHAVWPSPCSFVVCTDSRSPCAPERRFEGLLVRARSKRKLVTTRGCCLGHYRNRCCISGDTIKVHRQPQALVVVIVSLFLFSFSLPRSLSLRLRLSLTYTACISVAFFCFGFFPCFCQGPRPRPRSSRGGTRRPPSRPTSRAPGGPSRGPRATTSARTSARCSSETTIDRCCFFVLCLRPPFLAVFQPHFQRFFFDLRRGSSFLTRFSPLLPLSSRLACLFLLCAIAGSSTRTTRESWRSRGRRAGASPPGKRPCQPVGGVLFCFVFMRCGPTANPFLPSPGVVRWFA